MERKTARFIGALAGFATMGTASAQAAGHAGASAPDLLPIESYSDLLRPIPNAMELLTAHDAMLLERARHAPPRIETVQYDQYGGYGGGDHHQHHHHHQQRYHHHEYYAPPPPPPEYYHHHHHQQGGAIILLPGLGIQVN